MKAAAALKITASDLSQLGLVDEIVPEPLGGAHNDVAVTVDNLRQALLKHLGEVTALSPAECLKQRYQKFRNYGRYFEPKASSKEARPGRNSE
jgi:acetyl-CoA carboxylase carboxyl transferase subunit alpha